ncbi:alpha/beta fold hydrolase [Natronorarus salvus]|uniref:alpha/beta fold hydrolase n=1 Tax=Natronorarus salvus TaxID=3117733 RepID=UPI002F2687C2
MAHASIERGTADRSVHGSPRRALAAATVGFAGVVYGPAVTEFEPARFAELTTPPVLLTGTENGQWAKDSTDPLDDALPNSRVVTFDGHGHAAMLTAPDRFSDEVPAFVRETH